MGTILSVCNSKGGSGKTCAVSLLAVNLAAVGYRVAIIDADPNGGFSAWYANSYEGPPLTVTAEIRHEEIVGHAMKQGETHDVTLIDNAGWANQTAAYSIGTADLLIIPIMGDRNSVIEGRKTAKQCAAIARLARRDIRCRVLLSRWEKRGLAERATLEDLAASGLVPLRQHIPDLATFKQSSFSGAIPFKGIIGSYAHKIIEELIELEAVPPEPDREAA
jgi:chromosome partitioning protein